MTISRTFEDWSPAQLAFALGYRINLVGDIGDCTAYLVGHRKPFSHSDMHAALSRLARRRKIDPANPPEKTPRALRNGREQV